jgi:hypothetical protein
VFIGLRDGIACLQFSGGQVVANCISTSNVYGFAGLNGSGAYQTTNIFGNYYNNIAVGNTTNWHVVTGTEKATNNAGLSGEAWMVGTGAVRFTIATTDFVDQAGTGTPPAYTVWPDLSPAAITSVQVENATTYFGVNESDISDAFRPAYTGSAYNTAVADGSLVAGLSYTIATVGTSDFTTVGASANTVGITFKATGVGDNTKTGTATLNAKYDIGAYEFDLGYGTWPNTVTVSTSGMVDGSRISINKQSDGTELRNELLSSETTDSFSYNTTVDVPVYLYLRKGSSANYYHPVKVGATILADGGLTYSFSGLQVEDIAATTITGNVATDWTINWATGAITHTSGTTRYSVQNLYSHHQNESDSSTNIDATPKMYGVTPTIFTLINDGSITAGDLEDLYGGSVEFTDGSIYANVYSVGGLSGTPDVYVYQGTTKLTSFWSAGHIDILVKTANAGGSLVSSGLVDGYARKWGYTYDNYQTDCSGAGRNVLPLATLADAAITETEVTVGGWSDVTFTFGSTSKDFGDGDGPQTYYLVIDCNNRPLSEVYQRAQYVCRAGASGTLNGVAAETYAKANAAYTANKAAPFGTYAGGVWTLAQGVWLDNVPSGDSLNYIVTDHAGGTHQNVVALNQSVTITGPTAGSRVQIYDTTNNVELFNSTTSPYYWEDPSAPVGDRAIRVRIAYVSGTSAKAFIEANIGTCGTASNNKDVTYLASQTNDTTYNSNAIDGPAIYATSGITFTDAATDRVNCNIAGGSVTWPTIYATFVYWNFTSTGIANDFTYISAPDTANYLLSGMKIRNTSATDLMVISGYGREATSGLSKDIIDTAGSTGNIFLAPDHVVPYAVSGTYAITGDISTVLAAIPAATDNATAVWANGTRTLTAGSAPSAADNAAAVRTELTTELARIDVAISTRLATAGYTAPPTSLDNAEATRAELTPELNRIDTNISSRQPTGEVSANITKINGKVVTGDGIGTKFGVLP